ncbi:hypothetical protein LF817_05955 [Halobacillus sp. A1]|uniref:hypothetical protein n=1 Tax=Halobacillus sp. A1 TaxID=2880262 RepID=UPI0020A62C7C|nr:hypothetical protein [Halobacillus sp. A1]MCP3030883.1 hypothetical protein [Halobacillus sp. A1]
MSNSKKGVERGQSITFRVPSDTPDHLLKQLTALKEKERRNFSSRIAQFVMDGVSNSLSKDKETVTIPLPRQLTKEQRSWMKHEHSEALMGSIIYQLMSDPTRAMTLLASLNSNSVNIDEALYLQEEAAASEEADSSYENESREAAQSTVVSSSDNDLDDLNLDSLQDDLRSFPEEDQQQEEDDDPLGDFFSSMNK